jgi:hypothetical protein
LISFNLIFILIFFLIILITIFMLFFSPASSFSLRLDGLDGEWSSDLFHLWCFRYIDMSNKFGKFMRFKILFFFNFFYGFMVVFKFFLSVYLGLMARPWVLQIFLINFFKWFFVFNFWIIHFILYRWAFFYKKKYTIVWWRM